MAEALDKMLDAAADLSVAEMREIKIGLTNRLPSGDTKFRVSGPYDTVCALNEWGHRRRAEKRPPGPVQALPTAPPGVTYVPPPNVPVVGEMLPALGALAPVPGRADKYSPPTIGDVKFIVNLALPSFFRIQQLRRLLDMAPEPHPDGQPISAELDKAEKARNLVKAWVHRAAPFTRDQKAELLDNIAEALGVQNKD